MKIGPKISSMLRMSATDLERREAMSKRAVKVRHVLAVAAVAFGLTITGAEAAVNEMSGKAKLTYTKKEVVPIGDAEEHVLMLGDASGVNTNTGKWEFMDGAKARSIGTQVQ